MHSLNPRDLSSGGSQRCFFGLSLPRVILCCAFAISSFFLAERPSIAGEGISLILNRTPQATEIEIFSKPPGDPHSKPNVLLQTGLAPHSMMVVRCGPGYQVRCRMDHSGGLALPLLPGGVIVIGPLPGHAQQSREISILNIINPADQRYREIFTPWLDGVWRGYRCARWDGQEKAYRIPVKILVDDDEAATPALWQARLSRRINDANQILLPFCGAFLDIVSFGTWESDAEITDFETGFREFISEVDPSPAVLAIGFSSQWATLSSPAPLGISAGPLSRHILVREYGRQITESERLETLLHELGHYFGAAHVPDDNSVMRPHLEKRPARERFFSIGFDPVNALILNTVIDELRAGRTEFADLSPAASQLLHVCYGLIEKADPTDETASRLARLLPLPSDNSSSSPAVGSVSRGQAQTAKLIPDQAAMAAENAVPNGSESKSKGHAARPATSRDAESRPPAAPSPNEGNKVPSEEPAADRSLDPKQDTNSPDDEPVVENAVMGARLVVREVVNTWRPPKPEAIPRGQPVGDYILEGLVRRAAEASLSLGAKGEQDRRGAFLLAIGVLTDDSSLLRNTPGLEDVFRQIESSEERKRRLSRLGIPTIFARQDWAQHFCVSAALVHLLGPGSARSLGLAKEWRDSQGDSGWSFADLAADLAGIRFAQSILSGQIPLEAVQTIFQIVDFIPPLKGYEEDIPFSRFVTSYGGLFGQRTNSTIAEIEKAIETLPAYQAFSEKPDY